MRKLAVTLIVATVLVTTGTFRFLVFEKDNWQYILGINKELANKVTPKVLVEIADSID